MGSNSAIHTDGNANKTERDHLIVISGEGGGVSVDQCSVVEAIYHCDIQGTALTAAAGGCPMMESASFM